MKRALAELRERLDARFGGDRRAWCVALSPLARPVAGVVVGSVMIMSTKKIGLVAAALVLMLAGGVAWIASRPDGGATSTPPRAPVPGDTVVAATSASTPASVDESPVEPPPPAAAGSERDVTGRVVDANGSPVPRARIVSWPEGLSSVVAASRAGVGESVARAAESGDDGRFRVAVHPRYASFAILAQSSGFAPATVRAVRPGSEEVLLELDSGGSLAGTVIDLEGRGIGGARVLWTGEVNGARVSCETASEPGGRYRLDGLPMTTGHGQPSVIQAAAAGYAPVSIDLHSGSPSAASLEKDIVLGRGARVTGRIVDADTNEPLGSVAIRFEAFDERVAMDLHPEAVSAADGSFSFPHLAAVGFYPPPADAGGSLGRVIGQFIAQPNGYARAAVEAPVRNEGDSWESELRAWPSAAIAGRVVDDRGAPAEGVRLLAMAHSAPNGYQCRATTGADGRFVFPDVPASRHAEIATRVAAMTPNGDWWKGAEVEVGVRAGDRVDAPDIVLPAWARAVIMVADESGKPVPGARVEHARGTMPSGGPSDAEGRLVLAFEAFPRDGVSVGVRAAGFARAITPSFMPSAEDPPTVPVTMEASRIFSGRVVFADGSPAPGARVSIRAEASRLHDTTASGRDGRFEFADLPPGPYDIVAAYGAAGGESPAQARLESVRADALDVVLELSGALPPGPAIDFDGLVTDAATGGPIGRFEASLVRDKTTIRASRERPGRFTVHGASPGEWRLRLTAPGYVPIDPVVVEIDEDGPTSPVAIELDRGATVRGTVRPDDGIDLGEKDYSLVFVRDDPGYAIGFTRFDHGRGPVASLERNGRYVATGFGPGRYTPRLTFHHASYEGGAQPPPGESIVVPPGASEIVYDFPVGRSGAASLRVSGDGIASREGRLRCEVRDLRGRVVHEFAVPRERSGASLQLPVGAYVARVLDGETEIARREFDVTTEPRGVSVHFDVP